MTSSVGWLSDGSVATLRAALVDVAPSMSQGQIVINDRVVTSNPMFFQGSAVVDRAFVIKFAWSQPAAQRIAHERAVLSALGDLEPTLPVPQVVAASARPALLITRLVEGEPLTWEAATTLEGDRRSRLVRQLAGFLAALHAPAALTVVDNRGVRLPAPEPQATTGELRTRLGRFIEVRQRPLVDRWCDWVDHVLDQAGRSVLLQGDLHGHNIVWDPDTGELRLVTDFEWASAGDPAYDFRYLPAQAPTPALFFEVAAAYEQASGRTVDIERVIAWHVRTVLGDALWRGEAGVALPGGGSPREWVDQLAERFTLMRTDPKA